MEKNSIIAQRGIGLLIRMTCSNRETPSLHPRRWRRNNIANAFNIDQAPRNLVFWPRARPISPIRADGIYARSGERGSDTDKGHFNQFQIAIFSSRMRSLSKKGMDFSDNFVTIKRAFIPMNNSNSAFVRYSFSNIVSECSLGFPHPSQ